MFVEGPVRIDAPLGALELGVVDAQVPGVAEGVARLLHRSIQDARAEVGGHLPGWLVDDIEQNYISPEKVKTLWAETGRRFVLRRAGEIVATIHIAKSETMILTVDRHVINVDESAYPGFKPPRHHHVVNLSVLHELRRARLGTLMIDGILRHFRHLFSGVGLWVRADPPWHVGLSGLGFVHGPALDVFLPASVERTAGVPHADFNQRYACHCHPPRPEMVTHKLQYVSMTRLFEHAAPARAVTAPPTRAREELRDCGAWTSTAEVTRPASVDDVADVLRWASQNGRKVTIRGQAQSYDAQSLGDDVVLSTERLAGVLALDDTHVTVRGGTTWRALLTALAETNARLGDHRYPPVVPSGIEASIGGVLASGTGGIGKGSLHHGMVIDHVASLLVVTGDGRRVACSAKQAAWLFDAVLCGNGRFGVIAEATLRLGSRPGFVTRETRVVGPDEVADALGEPSLEHASAERQGDHYRVLLAYPSDRGLPIAEHLLPPRASFSGPQAAVRAQLTRASLGTLLRGTLERPEQPGSTFRVHPVRERKPRPGLVFFAQATAPVEPRERDDARVRAWSDDERRMKALADPRGILGAW